MVCNLLAFILISTIWGSNTAKRVSSMLFVAWFTHHIRDANRRGMWFGFLFTTRSLSRTIYLGTILILPLLLRYDLFAWLTRAVFFTTTRLFKSTIPTTTTDTHII